MLTLQLVKVPSALVAGPNNKVYNSHMPERALYVHPSRWEDFKHAAKRCVYTDIFRSPESSLHAMMTKAGVQPPSYSSHNYGFADDVVIAESLVRGSFKNRTHLDQFLAEECNQPMFWIKYGADNPGTKSIPIGHDLYNRGLETYHHSWFPKGTCFAGLRDTAGIAEEHMLKVYGSQLTATDIECQDALSQLNWYHGALDGRFGPQSESALGMFQRALKIELWHRKKRGKGPAYREGKLDPVTIRCLMYCTAKKEIITP